jgi:hypothetical protein
MKRRDFLAGLGALVAAPAIARATSLKPFFIGAPSPTEYEAALAYVQAEIEKALFELLQKSGPISYTDEGIEQITFCIETTMDRLVAEKEAKK